MVFSEKLEKLLQSFKQMDVDRKLREELRMDSQRLHEEFREEYRKRRKRPYGESHPHNVFIPRRFEDLKLNGGSKLRRIPIKLNYHRPRFKKLKSKSPRRILDSKGLLDRTFQRRCVGMKKQYHQKKRTAQVKLAQACKSLGMFLVSPSFRDPKDCMKICVVKRQIIDTGVRPETHLFWYEFTSYEPTDIDGHVDTRIGDQSIFAEDVTALEHDDPEAGMKSLKDETVMELEEPSKYKSSEERSHSGRRWFHKVRFKFILHQRSKVAAEKVTKGGELENLKSLNKGRSRNLTVRWYYYKVRKRDDLYGKDAGYKKNSVILRKAQSLSIKRTLRLRKVHVRGWFHRARLKSGGQRGSALEPDKLSPTDTERDLILLLMGCDHFFKLCYVNYISRVWEPGDLVDLIAGNGFEKYQLSGRLQVEKVLWCDLMDGHFDGIREKESVNAAGLWMGISQVIFDAVMKLLHLCLQRNKGSERVMGYEWDPGGVSFEKTQEFVFNIMYGLLEMEQTREKCFANSELELLRRKAHHMKDEGAKLSRAATHNRDILSQCYYVDRRIMLYAFEDLTPYQKLKVWDPGQAIVFHDKTFPSYGDVITVSITDFLGLEDKAVILPGSTLKFYGEKSEEQQQRYNTLVSELSLLMALGTTPAVWWLCAVMIGATAIRDTMEIRTITVLCTFLIVEGSSRQLWNMSRQEELICATLFYLNEKINETRDSVNDLTETASVQSKEVKQAQHISAATNHTSSNLTCGDIHVMVEYKSTQIVVIGYAWDPMDPPSDSFVTAYLVLFFTGMEEVMDFYFYDWFQSPRPPELNDHDNGARVITLRTFHQLEDKLVLHRGSIDKSPNGL